MAGRDGTKQTKPSCLEVSGGLDGSQALADMSGERVSKQDGGQRWDEANHGKFYFQGWSGGDNRPSTDVYLPNGRIRPSKRSDRYQHMEWG